MVHGSVLMAQGSPAGARGRQEYRFPPRKPDRMLFQSSCLLQAGSVKQSFAQGGSLLMTTWLCSNNSYKSNQTGNTPSQFLLTGHMCSLPSGLAQALELPLGVVNSLCDLGLDHISSFQSFLVFSKFIAVSTVRKDKTIIYHLPHTNCRPSTEYLSLTIYEIIKNRLIH